MAQYKRSELEKKLEAQALECGYVMYAHVGDDYLKTKSIVLVEAHFLAEGELTLDNKSFIDWLAEQDTEIVYDHWRDLNSIDKLMHTMESEDTQKLFSDDVVYCIYFKDFTRKFSDMEECTRKADQLFKDLVEEIKPKYVFTFRKRNILSLPRIDGLNVLWDKKSRLPLTDYVTDELVNMQMGTYMGNVEVISCTSTKDIKEKLADFEPLIKSVLKI